MSLKKFLETLKRRVRGKLLILTHRYADIDAVASAIGLLVLVKTLDCDTSESVIVSPQGLSKPAKNVVERLAVNVSIYSELPPGFENPDSIVIVDAASPSQLPGLTEILNLRVFKALIDHHVANTLIDLVDASLVDPSATSTSEIIALALPREALSEEIAALLIAGIIADSGRFQRATPRTFRVMSKLSRACEYSRVLRLTEVGEPPSFSERIAVLKAAQRMVIETINDIVVAGTHVGSFESEVASHILRLGADIALVVSRKKDEVRVIMRSRPRLRREGLAIIEHIARKLGGSWGGHAGAGALTLSIRVEKRNLPSLVKTLVNEAVTYLRTAGVKTGSSR